MARLGLRQALCSLLVLLLFSPVVLAVGSDAFRFALYRRTLLGIPAFPVLIMALTVVFVVLVWIFASAAFSDKAEGRP